MYTDRWALVLMSILATLSASYGQDATTPRQVSLSAPEIRGDGSVVTAISIDNAGDVVAGDVDLAFDAARTRIVDVRAGELIRGFFLLSNVVQNTLRVSFAAGSPTQGNGTLFEVISDGDGLPAFSIVHVSLNGDQIPATYERPTLVGDGEAAASDHEVGAFPNPFNASTAIRFSQAQPEDVELTIYSAAGQHVATLARRALPAGLHELRWDGRDISGAHAASGRYFVRLRTSSRQQTVAVTLLR